MFGDEFKFAELLENSSIFWAPEENVFFEVRIKFEEWVEYQLIEWSICEAYLLPLVNLSELTRKHKIKNYPDPKLLHEVKSF